MIRWLGMIALLAAWIAPSPAFAADLLKGMPRGTYAVLDTTEGQIACRLFDDKTPKTVANFVGLAEGKKEWTDPKTGKMVKRPFFDGLVFHRVIPGFMIQGGDPLGNGTGGPGYAFADEISKDLTFDTPGKVAMANAGPNTNGSQFFITVGPATWLDGHYNLFGEVVAGQDVADKIARAPRVSEDRPEKPVAIKKVTIRRVK